MGELQREKLAQASTLAREEGLDAWILFVRETAAGSDPALPLILDGGLTWQSALIVTPDRRVAIVGNYDAEVIQASGGWDEIIPYVADIHEPLVRALEQLAPSAEARLGVNFSTTDDKADGLSYGMFLLLERYLAGTRFEGRLESAETVCRRLRGNKTPTERRLIKEAIRETERLINEIAAFAAIGRTELEIQAHAQGLIDSRGFGYAWDKLADPIINSGPDSAIGHAAPSAEITLQPGHIFHMDIGIQREGYCSDLQRSFYVGKPGETQPPEDVWRAFDAVNGAITAAARVLRPGVQAYRVDEIARNSIKAAGYKEYLHALGHQVGRLAHDGGAVLGPRWPRYGNSPTFTVQKDEIYTLELGIELEDRGYLGIEEMVVVTETGCEFLSRRQETLGVSFT